MAEIYKNYNSLTKLMLIVTILVFFPLIVVITNPDQAKYAGAFITAGILSLIFSLINELLQKNNRNLEETLNAKSGALTVLFIWVYGVVIGALPFVFANQLTFVQATFEAVSGWTTTGLSVMDVSITPTIFLFHRAFMQFCGGLGFVMMMVMIVQDKKAMSLFNAEGHPDKLAGNLGKTSRTIFIMYVFYLVVGTWAYMLFKMPFFDAITNAMCALSTGGFSIRVESIGYYHSLAAEIITIVLMLIGTTNFAVLLLLSKRRFKQLARVSEVRFMTVLLVASTLMVAMSLVTGLYMSLGEGIRQAVFNVVSALSTSGFSTMLYTDWPDFAIGMLIILMLIGGGIGSTAGGIKLTRVLLVFKIIKNNINQKMNSSRMVTNPYFYRAQGKTYIDKALESDIVGFVLLYMIIYIVGSMLLTLTANCSLTEAMFEFASSLSTVGLSIGITNPTTNDPTLIVELIGMMLGRLEIFIVIIGMKLTLKKVIEYWT